MRLRQQRTFAKRGVALGLALGALATTGCHPRAAPTTARPRVDAPYQLADRGRLRVRPDLLADLRVAPVEQGDVQSRVQGFGRVVFAPNGSHAIRSPFAATAERVYVAVGDAVERGAPLALLRSPEVARLRGEAARLVAQIAAERDAIARVERLTREGAASEREVIEARTRLGVALAESRGVHGALQATGAGPTGDDHLVLRAVAAGRVLMRFVDPGERVAPEDADPAFLVGDPTALQVLGSFPERDAPLLQDGAACSFTVPALGTQRFSGTLVGVARAIDRSTRTATASCRPERLEARLQPEMIARVEVLVRGTGMLVVPRAAVLLHRDEHVLFVQRDDGLLERRSVEAGANLSDRVQILRGVQPGERVVTEGAVLLDGELDRVL